MWQYYLWDLEQTFAPFPAKDARLSFTYTIRIKLIVDVQAQKKEMPIFRGEKWYCCLRRIRVKGDCSIRESAYCKVVSTFNSTQEICRDSSRLFPGPPYLCHFNSIVTFFLPFRTRIKVLVLSNQWYNLYANPFWREHETKRDAVALSSVEGGVGVWPGGSIRGRAVELTF